MNTPTNFKVCSTDHAIRAYSYSIMNSTKRNEIPVTQGESHQVLDAVSGTSTLHHRGQEIIVLRKNNFRRNCNISVNIRNHNFVTLYIYSPPLK